MNSSPIHIARAGLVLLLGVSLLIAGTGGATAATNTTVSVTPTTETTSVGDTTTFEIQVDTVDNGISSYEFQAELSDPGVAEITNVSLEGTSSEDQLTTVNISENGSSVSVNAGVASHDNGTIATVTVETTDTGTTQLDLSDVALGDDDASSYTVDSINSSAVTVQGQSTPVTLHPPTRTVPNGDSAQVAVIVPDADAGISSYEFMASTEDTSAVTIENVSLAGASRSDSTSTVSLADDGSSVSVAVGVADVDDERIATLHLDGHSVGDTQISVSDAAVGNEDARSYRITETGNATVQVQEPPNPVVGENKPSDIDGDGTFEDVNGDGEFNVVDVSAVLQNRDAESVSEAEGFYDYNGDGEFTIVDVNALLQQSADS